MKDSAPSGVEEFLKLTSPSFHVLAGSVGFMFRAMMGGAVGVHGLAERIPSPGLAMELFRLGQARDEGARRPLPDARHAINKAISGGFGPAGVQKRR